MNEKAIKIYKNEWPWDDLAESNQQLENFIDAMHCMSRFGLINQSVVDALEDIAVFMNEAIAKADAID